MAQQIINVGSAPNDRSGETLRAAWQKVNLMFQEVYATLQSIVTDQSAKVSTGQVVRTDASQMLTAAQKIRAALNGGHLVTLTTELIAPDAVLTTGTYFILTLPHHFLLFDSVLTVRDAEHGATLTAVLQKEESNGAWSNVHSSAGGIAERVITLGASPGGFSLTLGTSLRLNVTAAADGYAGATYGLTATLRGVWA